MNNVQGQRVREGDHKNHTAANHRRIAKLDRCCLRWREEREREDNTGKAARQWRNGVGKQTDGEVLERMKEREWRKAGKKGEY